jgi:large subunit ribosomal protein LP0
MAIGGSKKPEKNEQARKADYFVRLNKLLDTYGKIFLVEADNVGSNQMHKIRISLRGTAVILMGKNTMIRKAIRGRLAAHPALEKILSHVVGNIGFVFTNDDLRTTRDLLLKERTAAPAKAGSLAPADVFIDAQNTGMGPEKTSFFQALGIATKITKGTIEIINQVHLIKKGDKVGASEATLLNMLGVSPFTYGLVVRVIYENGAVFKSEILDISDEDLLTNLTEAVKNVAAFSLAISFPTVASVPHIVIKAFKEILAISIATDYTFPASEKIKEYLADPSKFAAAAPAPAAAAPVSRQRWQR